MLQRSVFSPRSCPPFCPYGPEHPPGFSDIKPIIAIIRVGFSFYICRQFLRRLVAPRRVILVFLGDHPARTRRQLAKNSRAQNLGPSGAPKPPENTLARVPPFSDCGIANTPLRRILIGRILPRSGPPWWSMGRRGESIRLPQGRKSFKMKKTIDALEAVEPDGLRKPFGGRRLTSPPDLAFSTGAQSGRIFPPLFSNRCCPNMHRTFTYSALGILARYSFEEQQRQADVQTCSLRPSSLRAPPSMLK